MKRKNRVYIAGPITDGGKHGHSIEGVQQALEVADELLEAGYQPFVPHLTVFWHYYKPHEYATWVGYSAEWLIACDCVLRIEGESKGADEEVELANEFNIPVWYSVEQVKLNEASVIDEEC